MLRRALTPLRRVASLISRVVTMKQFLYKCCIDMQYYLQNLNISFVIFHRLGTQCDPDAHGKSLTISLSSDI